MENNVAGFTKRFGKKGDIVYFIVKDEKISYLIAKGLLGEETYKKPWEDSERYILEIVSLEDIVMNLMHL